MSEQTSAHPLWSEQVAIVTGGGKGLGRAFALDLARRGARVVVNNRRREVDENGLSAADHVVAEIRAAGGEAIADYSAVEDPNSGHTLVQAALEKWGRLDIVITSAGISGPQMFHKADPTAFRTVLDINVMGTMHVTSAASAVMREAGHGRILMVASSAGLHGEPTVSAYAASKGAIIALAKTVAVEGARRGVFTNAILPFATTQMTDAGMDPRYVELMSPEAVAPVATALVDPASTINGLTVIAGATGVRIGETSEGGTETFTGNDLTPRELGAMLERSRSSARHQFPEAQAAFQSIAADLCLPED